jgi:hypothetical protein
MFRRTTMKKERNRAASVLRASRRTLRSRGLQVLLGTAALSGAALGQTYFRFELVNTAFHNPPNTDQHMLIGELAASTPLSTSQTPKAFLNTLDFNPPTAFSDSAHWSSNVAGGKGGIIESSSSVNYAITRIGGFSGTYACAATCTSSRYYIASMEMYWTDASGASYYVKGSSNGSNGAANNSWQVYNATWNSVDGYQKSATPITPPGGGNFLVTWQNIPDSIQGSFQRAGIEDFYAPNTFPEIDGSALPKAGLLVFSLYLVTRSRKDA